MLKELIDQLGLQLDEGPHEDFSIMVGRLIPQQLQDISPIAFSHKRLIGGSIAQDFRKDNDSGVIELELQQGSILKVPSRGTQARHVKGQLLFLGSIRTAKVKVGDVKGPSHGHNILGVDSE